MIQQRDRTEYLALLKTHEALYAYHPPGAKTVTELNALLKRYDIKSITDAPCGHFGGYMNRVDLQGIDYFGVDIQQAIIADNIKQYPGFRFDVCDLVQCDIRKADLIICRHLFFHLLLEDGVAVLEAFRRSGSTYLLATNEPGVRKNTDRYRITTPIRDWGYRGVNLEIEPFNLGTPIDDFTDMYPERQLSLWELS
jgi:hypothetical protein